MRKKTISLEGIMNKILVTGGAGYIGSHVVKKLLEEGLQVVVLDNFSTGYVEPLEILADRFKGLKYVEADLTKKKQVDAIFKSFDFKSVIHLAAKIDVAESVKKPHLHHQVNYTGSINLLEGMMKKGVNEIIFSSTAATYGDPKYTPIDELHPTQPQSPYAETKLKFENYLHKKQNLNYVIFRYFNVGGSSEDSLIGKSHLQSQDLIENIFKVALGQKDFFEVYGSDYDTKDGTSVRDFVHVEDVVSAHLAALKKINKISGHIFNLGSENGFSVSEIINKMMNMLDKKIPTKYCSRRPGDLSVSVASAKKAQNLLGWRPNKSNIDTIIASDWRWRKDHPFGYTK